MNRYIETANFDIEKFPLDCGTLRGAQDNTAILAVLARIAAGNGTDRLILCGCEDMRNGYRGEGYIWKASEERPLTGEIIYHPEQSLQNEFLIEEMSESVNVDNTDYLNLYRHKVANDTSIGCEVWSEYTRLDEVSNVALKALIDELERQTAAEAKARAEADEALDESVEARLVSLRQNISNEGQYRSQKDMELEQMITQMSGVPKGVICMWSGSSSQVPEGWALCNGQNGTPNLVGKFIKGGASAGATGGSDIITIKAENIPRLLDVGFNGGNSRDGAPSPTIRVAADKGNWTGTNFNKTNTYNAGWSSGHDDSHGSYFRLTLGRETPTSINITPTYYTLCYIIKL